MIKKSHALLEDTWINGRNSRQFLRKDAGSSSVAFINTTIMHLRVQDLTIRNLKMHIRKLIAFPVIDVHFAVANTFKSATFKNNIRSVPRT